MSFSSSKCYDLEVWSPGEKKYLEVSSCSNFESFQAQRGNIKFRNNSNKLKHLHTLNGSGIVTPRLMVAILENFQKGNNLYDQFVRGMKNLNKIQFSENQEQRLLEARGAMYLFMFNNQEFRDTLISEYEKRKQVLPFYLKV